MRDLTPLAVPRTATRDVKQLVAALREDKTSSEATRVQAVLSIASLWNVASPDERQRLIEDIARAARLSSVRALRQGDRRSRRSDGGR